MILTRKQEEGLRIVLDKYKNGSKYAVIAGYAGTGKSTLVRFIVDAIGVEESKVVYAAYTGKAAEVLRKKGNRNSMTLHRLLYESFPLPGGGFLRNPKSSLEYTIVIVDEISMLPKSMLNELLRHNVFCIFLGDPFQLPVINKDEANDLLDNPDIFLDEVMRQAQESEIIRLTMDIRQRKNILPSTGKEVIVIPKHELVTGHLTWADQVICGTNATRISINNQMRELYGHSGLPQNGEKLICLKNQWEDLSNSGSAVLVNGMTGIIKNPFESFRMAPRYVKMKNHKMEIIKCDFVSEDGEIFNSVEMDKKMLETGEYSLDWREEYALGKLSMKIGDIKPRQFTYGYCISCHKAQGSEWEKVTVIEERFPFDKLEHARWLYTASTRASQKLVLVRS